MNVSISLSKFLPRARKPVVGFLLALLALSLISCAVPALPGQRPITAATRTPTSTATATPSPTAFPYSYTPARQLLAKVVTTGPIYVTGDATVPDAALNAAGAILAAMLAHRPDLVEALRRAGAFIAVAPRDKMICSLPYFTDESQPTCDRFGYGGAGATLANPVTACGERNLLKEHDDPYLRGQGRFSQNICLHELAHMVMNVALSYQVQSQIVDRYAAAHAEKRWEGDYADTDSKEFWAVMSQFYFWAGPNAPYSEAFVHVANGPQALRAYDPQTFALVDSIYQGSADLR